VFIRGYSNRLPSGQNSIQIYVVHDPDGVTAAVLDGLGTEQMAVPRAKRIGLAIDRRLHDDAERRFTCS
jgi:hypothetical protein